MRHVVINAMCSPYPEEQGPGVEIWGVNRTFQVEPRCDRIYFFDPHTLFQGDLLSDLAALDIPVYTRKAIEQVPRSVAFPLERIRSYFGLGDDYWDCTLAYMVSHAIFEHCSGRTIDKLTLNGMFHPRDSMEYFDSKACVEFWVGVAMGKGMNIELYGFNSLCKPLPWKSGTYGYVTNRTSAVASLIISAAYKGCYELPRSFVTADQEIADALDAETLLSSLAIHESRIESIKEKLELLGVPTGPPKPEAAACA